MQLTMMLKGDSNCKSCLDKACADVDKKCAMCQDQEKMCNAGCRLLKAGGPTCKSACGPAIRGTAGLQCNLCRNYQLPGRGRNSCFKRARSDCDDTLAVDSSLTSKDKKKLRNEIVANISPYCAQSLCGQYKNDEDGKQCSVVGDNTTKIMSPPAPVTVMQSLMMLNSSADCKSCLDKQCGPGTQNDKYCSFCPNTTDQETCRSGCRIQFARSKDSCLSKCQSVSTGTEGAACLNCGLTVLAQNLAGGKNTAGGKCRASIKAECKKDPTITDANCKDGKLSSDAGANISNFGSLYGDADARNQCKGIVNYEDLKPCVTNSNQVVQKQ